MTSWKLRYEVLGSHVHVDVFCGRHAGARGLAGRLVMRVGEWQDFLCRWDNVADVPELFEIEEVRTAAPEDVRPSIFLGLRR